MTSSLAPVAGSVPTITPALEQFGGHIGHDVHPAHAAHLPLHRREIIANALLHGGLERWSAGMAIEVRLRRDRLIVSNPGGLYGITVDRLGRDVVTSAGKARLVAICQHTRTPQTSGSYAFYDALAAKTRSVADLKQELGLSAPTIRGGPARAAIARTYGAVGRKGTNGDPSQAL